MAYGEKEFSFTIASGAAVVNEAAANVAGYQFASIYVQTLTTATTVKMLGGLTSTAAQLRPVFAMGVYSAGSGILEWAVPDSMGNFTTADVPIWGQNYIKPVLNTAATDGATSIIVRVYNQ